MEQQTARKTFQELIESDTPVLVDFYADWCGPCKAMNPIVQDVARQLANKARVVKVDIDKSQAASQQFQISAVPTFILFKNGKSIWRHSGMLDKNSLLRVIETHL